jgi:hypothetical protein
MEVAKVTHATRGRRVAAGDSPLRRIAQGEGHG